MLDLSSSASVDAARAEGYELLSSDEYRLLEPDGSPDRISTL